MGQVKASRAGLPWAAGSPHLHRPLKGRGVLTGSTGSTVSSPTAPSAPPPASPRSFFPIPAPGEGKGLPRGPPPQGGGKLSPGRQRSGEETLRAATPPSLPRLWLPSPRSRHRPLSTATNSSPGPEPALTHVLLEGVGGEQRHLAHTRALVAAVWLRRAAARG